MAQEVENIHGPRNVEIQKIKQMLKERGLMIQEIPSDGNWYGLENIIHLFILFINPVDQDTLI
jgi:hypothetical protein